MTDSLPQRMRESAKVLEEVERREDCICNGKVPYSASELRHLASKFESEDRNLAVREATVEELARVMYCAHFALPIEVWERDSLRVVESPDKQHWRDIARKLIDLGWAKIAVTIDD